LHRANRKDDFKEESPNTHVTQISVINRRSEAERAWGEDCTTQCHKAEFIHKEIKKEKETKKERKIVGERKREEEKRNTRILKKETER
jgi:hypothetical protein